MGLFNVISKKNDESMVLSSAISHFIMGLLYSVIISNTDVNDSIAVFHGNDTLI